MYYRLLVLATTLYLPISQAHQPVMDMAPRWDDGFGFQLWYENYGSSELLNGSQTVSNPKNLERYVQTTWLQGVYTFDRSVRVTFKLPYRDQQRVKEISNTATQQSNSGVGDLVIGVPIKKYLNQGNSTGNLSLTPSIRLPSGSSSGNYPLSDGSWDLGLSLSYSKSTPKFYQLYDVFYWYNTEGDRGMQEGNELGIDINLGYHPYHDNLTNSGVFVMWDITMRDQESPNTATLTHASGGERVHTGPVLVLYKDNIMFRAEYKYPLYEKSNNVSLSRGQEFNIGIGVTF
ncbi:transporter [Kangiella sp. HD9-110m-PIT-SAG07]|nr:transporter [Kangiella sp. HD9-110m-PIT-SAG07]